MRLLVAFSFAFLAIQQQRFGHDPNLADSQYLLRGGCREACRAANLD